MNKRCVDCFNFKSMILNERNLANSLFYEDKRLLKRIYEEGMVRIWWCSRGVMIKDFYMNKYMVSKLRKNCKVRSE